MKKIVRKINSYDLIEDNKNCIYVRHYGTFVYAELRIIKDRFLLIGKGFGSIQITKKLYRRMLHFQKVGYTIKATYKYFSIPMYIFKTL